MRTNYPKAFDTDQNLFFVRDSLKLSLQNDYNPGDTSLVVEGDTGVFPPSGILTITDQVSIPEERSVSLWYEGKTSDTFFGLNVMPDSKDVFKPKNAAVAMQVRAEHHNTIASAVLAIQKVLGRPSDRSNSLIGRVNALLNTAHTPKAWFEANKTLGIAPFTVNFTSASHGSKGPVGAVTYDWDFGDGSTLSSQERAVAKTYTNPGTYDVSLTITNSFGANTVKLPRLINVRVEAPDEAVIEFSPQPGQILKDKTLRTPVGQLVKLEVKQGENPKKSGTSYAGEPLHNQKPLDPITKYTWNLADDLTHANEATTHANYGVSGLHDLTLRVDTKGGAYRITNYEKALDVVEVKNLWLWVKTNSTRAFEFGLNNETFKVKNTTPVGVRQDDSFLNGDRQKQEFARNNGFAPLTGQPSGLQGSCLLFWAANQKEVHFAEYFAFGDTYSSNTKPLNRAWNWASFVSPQSVSFILGEADRQPPSMSPTNPLKTELFLGSGNIKNSEYGYANGAQEVKFNSGIFDDKGVTKSGHFSLYRTTWKDDVGYLLRSVWSGGRMMLKNFYKTDGTLAYPFLNLAKLPDVPGGGIPEGQLVSLRNGVYLFSNVGAAFGYKDKTGTWQVISGKPGDYNVIGHNNEANTLLAVSDGDCKAFLSFDYSPKAFIRFNEADLTFTTLGPRPAGKQWLAGIY